MDTASEMRLIDAMSGSEFENFVVALLKRRGFAAEIVGGANDKGVDIVATKDGLRYAIQCKRHGAKISRSAVSDCVAGMRLYHCQKAMVITNSSFHDGAVQLAAANDCHLIGRPALIAWMTNQPIETDAFTDPSSALHESEIEVRVLSAEIGPVMFESPRAENTNATVDTNLLIRMQLQNNSDTRKFNFRSWGMDPHGYAPSVRKSLQLIGWERAELSDNFENEYHLRHFSFPRLDGQIPEQAIYPRKCVYDLLIFEPPVERMQCLYLRLPSERFSPNSKRVLRFKIPAEALARAASTA